MPVSRNPTLPPIQIESGKLGSSHTALGHAWTLTGWFGEEGVLDVDDNGAWRSKYL